MNVQNLSTKRVKQNVNHVNQLVLNAKLSMTVLLVRRKENLIKSLVFVKMDFMKIKMNVKHA